MGRKKRQSQTSNNGVVGDSSDSADSREQAQYNSSKSSCVHIKKSVDQVHIQKCFRSSSDVTNFFCSECKKASKTPEETWMCLKCGSCGCGTEDDHHARTHFEVPRSDSHCIALQLDKWTVWCFKCQQEIPADSNNKRLDLVVEYAKQQFTKFTDFSTKSDTGQANPPIPLKMVEIVEPVPSEDVNNLKQMEFTRLNKNAALNGKKKKVFQQFSGACEVSGLMNLGNTCFFNSVLQCLAQTPGLVDLLRQMEVPGELFYMPVKDAEPINTTLEGTKGNVSEALCSVLEDVACTGCERGDGNRIVNPSRLLSALRKKCPQFEGGDQHDAHELLRHLLDTVRTEDLRRYQEAILRHVGLSKSTNPKEVDEKRKTLVKSLKQPLCDMLIRPDHIFRGSLVSTLVCQNCNHTSERHESFLDLSLPVSPEKPQPPAVTRRNKNANSLSPTIACEGGAQVDCKPAMSKHQLKKERKQQQRRGRSKRSSHANTDVNGSKSGEPTILEEDKKDSDSEDEQSDADVEDNEDGGCEDQTRQEVTESGYSSEKQTSPRESPLAHSLEEDSDVHNKSPVQLRSESGLGSSTVSVQELTVSIPENQSEVTVGLISPDSTRANASPGSPEISSDSLQEEKLTESLNNSSTKNDDTDVTCTGVLVDSCANPCNKNEIVFDWECNPFSGNENSDECDYNVPNVQEAKDNDFINRFGSGSTNLENEEININSHITASDSNKNSCLAVFTDVEENTLISPLVSPQKLNFNENNNSITKETTQETQLFCDNIARSSPVEMSDSTTLDSKLLNLSLEAYKTENKIENEKSDCTRSLGGSDEELQKIEANSNIITSAPSDMGFVLVGGIAASGPNFSKNVVTSPEPQKNVDTSEEDDVDDDTEYELGRSKQATLSGRYQSSDGECSLQTCLSQFTAIEMLAGNNKVGCSVCTKHHSKGNKDCKTVYTVHSKQLLISQAPPVLIFHLKRFQVQMFSFRKLSRHVAFPLVLDIAPFCSVKCESVKPGEKQILYSLYGVVEHSGTLHGGHYIAYVKVRQKTEERSGVPSPGKWYYVSDSRVMEAPESSVLSSQAYLLFYERIL